MQILNFVHHRFLPTILLAAFAACSSKGSPASQGSRGGACNCASLPAAHLSATPTPPEAPLQRAEPSEPEAPKKTLDFLVAGRRLEIFESQTTGEVWLDHQVLFRGSADQDSAPWREMVGYFGKIPPFDAVVLLRWGGPGNACNGYGYTFLGINEDGTHRQSDVPFCGGVQPLITVTPTQVTFVVPDGPRNRGDGIVPGETWVYRNGSVSQIPQGGSKPAILRP